MRILHISYDTESGAGRALYRLHSALIEKRIDSQVLVQNKTCDDYTVNGPETTIKKAIAKIKPHFDSFLVKKYKKRANAFFSPSWIPSFDMVDTVNKINPDVVHLHWICNGMLSIHDLRKIKKPICWSMHDCWAFSGGCHYPVLGCEKYKSWCEFCEHLNSEKANDLSYKVFKRKKRIYEAKEKMVFIGLSRWITECAKESALLKNKRIINLPNVIDTSNFTPIDKKVARSILNISSDKKIVLFGALEATSDIRKGYKELSEAINKLKLNDIELVIFGSSKPEKEQNLKYNAHYMGYMHDDISLRVLYSAANVVIVPSLQENLSNVILESMACGTPVVAFDIGGNSDLITHKANGFLARPQDSTDLASGIAWVLERTQEEYNKLCDQSRLKIVENFSATVITEKYISLYNELLRD